MPLIEGIGDEVTVVMSILILCITMAVAWISTLVADRPATSMTFTRNDYLDQDLIQEDELPEEVYRTNITQNEFDNIVADANQEIENITAGHNGEYAENLENEIQNTNHNGDNTEENLERSDSEVNSESIIEAIEKRESTDNIKSEPRNSNEIESLASTSASENITEQSIESNSQEDSEFTDNPTVQMIRIRLKFLNESERTVNVNPNLTLSQFKRDAFVEERNQGFSIRLILNGQVLQDDQRTLAQLNINNNCVIHCQLLEARNTVNTVDSVNSELDIGQIMIPMFAVLLGLVWYVRLEYRHLFTATSTLSLLGVSVLFFLAVLASWRS